MANISQTAGSVLRVDGEVEQGLAGGTITAGQLVKKSTSDGSFTACAKDSAANAAAYGAALNGASSGQPVQVQKNGTINPGGTVAIGMGYWVGSSGGWMPSSDIASGDYTTFAGIGITASTIKMGILAGGVAAASDVT